MEHIRNIMPLVEQAIAIRKQIANLILNLPDNNRINRISSNAFTLNSSELLNENYNLSPLYHDFKRQYRMIANALLSIPIENTEQWLKAICNRGYFQAGPTKVTLHPMVIENIRRAFNGE